MSVIPREEDIKDVEPQANKPKETWEENVDAYNARVRKVILLEQERFRGLINERNNDKQMEKIYRNLQSERKLLLKVIPPSAKNKNIIQPLARIILWKLDYD